MSKLDRYSRAAYRLAALLVLAVLTQAVVAQEAADVLAPAAEALRLDSITGIRFTASGSGYEPAELAAEGTTAGQWAPPPTGGASVENGFDGAAEAEVEPGTTEWFEQAAAALVRALNPEPEPRPPVSMRHFRVVQHVETLDLETASLRIERERAPGAGVVALSASDGDDSGAGASRTGGARGSNPSAAAPASSSAASDTGGSSAKAVAADVSDGQGTPDTDETEGAEGSDSVETRIIGAASTWSDRIDYWTHPAAFVAHALSRDALVSRQTIAGTEYVVVSVEAERGRAVRGYLDAEQRVVRTTSEFLDSTGRPVEVEVSWLRWREFGNLSFPTTIVRKHNGALVAALIVTSVEAIER